MNANELADELETYDWIPDDAIWIKKAATMLRQQQAQIEALKAKLSLWEEFGRQVVGCKPNEGTR